METFLFSLEAVTPLILTIGLGVFVRHRFPWDDAFYRRLNGLCFHLFLPIHLFSNIYGISDLSAFNWPLIGVLTLGIFASLGLGWIVARLLVPRRDQKGVMIQAAFRSNHAILGLPLAESLGGAPAAAFASVSASVCVPVFNALAVLVLHAYAGTGRPRPAALFRQMLRNPLIGASLAAVLCVLLRRLLGLDRPLLQTLPAVYGTLRSLSGIASPLMLFVLGAGLDFRRAGSLFPKIALGTALRLILSPALVLAVTLYFRDLLTITQAQFPAVLAVCASPVAVSSAVMTQEIGGDSQLAGQLVVWSSICSMGTLFVLVYLLRSVGAL